MKKYVLGFAFEEGSGQVALILKNRPAWQAGKLNGIGGSIEEGETPLVAMVREFVEESGVQTEQSDWTLYARMRGAGFEVFVMRATLEAERFSQLRTCTDESVLSMPAFSEELGKHAISNVPWLIAAARDADCGRTRITVEYGDPAPTRASDLLREVSV